jgi:hypothetical protein
VEEMSTRTTAEVMEFWRHVYAGKTLKINVCNEMVQQLNSYFKMVALTQK